MAGPKAYVLDEQLARWVKQSAGLRFGEDSGPIDIPYTDSQQGSIHVLNTAAEAVPAYGIMQVTGYLATSNGRIVVTVTKPSTTIANMLVNGAYEIPVNALSVVQVRQTQLIAYNVSTISTSKNYGINGFKIDDIPTGNPIAEVRVIADYDATKKICLGSIRNLQSILFQAPVGGIGGRASRIEGSAVCTIISNRSDNDSLVATSVTAKVRNWTTTAICTKGERYGVAAWISGGWKAVAEDCNDQGKLPPGKGSSKAVDVGNPFTLNFDPPSVVGQIPNVSYTLGTGTGGV